jgi:hypothetical protein
VSSVSIQSSQQEASGSFQLGVVNERVQAQGHCVDTRLELDRYCCCERLDHKVQRQLRAGFSGLYRVRTWTRLRDWNGTWIDLTGRAIFKRPDVEVKWILDTNLSLHQPRSMKATNPGGRVDTKKLIPVPWLPVAVRAAPFALGTIRKGLIPGRAGPQRGRIRGRALSGPCAEFASNARLVSAGVLPYGPADWPGVEYGSAGIPRNAILLARSTASVR